MAIPHHRRRRSATDGGGGEDRDHDDTGSEAQQEHEAAHAVLDLALGRDAAAEAGVFVLGFHVGGIGNKVGGAHANTSVEWIVVQVSDRLSMRSLTMV